MHARRVNFAVAAVAALALHGCGAGRGGPQPPLNDRPGPGGSLSVVGVEGAPALDPHRVTTPLDAMVHRALYRQLYVRLPGTRSPVPDLAAGPPQVSDDGRTVTVVLRRRARFSDDGDPIVASDIKRGLQRALSDPVAGRRWRREFTDVVGLATPGLDGAIAGIDVPSDERLVLRLRRSAARTVIAGLATPATTPVRASTSAGQPMAPGVDASGPYLVDVPGASAPIAPDVVRLRRSSVWSRDADVRPAYADAIMLIPQREIRTDALAREVLTQRGRMLFGPPPPAVVSLAERRAGTQVTIAPRPVTRYIAIVAGRGPLADRDVRRALLAAVDRAALLRASGARGELASHFLAPGVAGHDESGGVDGTGAETLQEPAGDLRLARRLLRSAGYLSGRIPSMRAITLVRSPSTSSAAMTRALARSWRPLGVRLRVSVRARDVAESVCLGPQRDPVICVDAVLAGEPADAGSLVGALARGSNIGPIREAAAEAAALEPGRLRDQAWAGINRALVDQAVGVPWRWDQRALLVSRDVLAVVDPTTGLWDLPFTSLDARSRR